MEKGIAINNNDFNTTVKSLTREEIYNKIEKWKKECSGYSSMNIKYVYLQDEEIIITNEPQKDKELFRLRDILRLKDRTIPHIVSKFLIDEENRYPWCNIIAVREGIYKYKKEEIGCGSWVRICKLEDEIDEEQILSSKGTDEELF